MDKPFYHRIRAAALVVNQGKLLLVKHVHPDTGSTFWVPPGGGLNAGTETIFDTAIREVYEETGLRVTLGRILYIKEFVDLETNVHHVEFFMLAETFKGEPTIANLDSQESGRVYIKEARFLSPADMQGRNVFPEILKDGFWQDLKSGAPTRYLGQTSGDTRKLSKE